MLLCIVAALAFVGNRALAESVAASDRTDYTNAAKSARTARSFQPWSGEPLRLLGEAQLASGDWELGLDLGLASDGEAQERAWRRAASLNPLSPEIQELG